MPVSIGFSAIRQSACCSVQSPFPFAYSCSASSTKSGCRPLTRTNCWHASSGTRTSTWMKTATGWIVCWSILPERRWNAPQPSASRTTCWNATAPFRRRKRNCTSRQRSPKKSLRCRKRSMPMWPSTIRMRSFRFRLPRRCSRNCLSPVRPMSWPSCMRGTRNGLPKQKSCASWKSR